MRSSFRIARAQRLQVNQKQFAELLSLSLSRHRLPRIPYGIRKPMGHGYEFQTHSNSPFT